MNLRQRKGIFLGPSIQFLKIDTEPESSIFLMDQYNSITPGSLAGLDGTYIEHVIQVFFYLFQEIRRDVPWSLLEGPWIYHFYLVFCSFCAPHLAIFQSEDIMVLCQQIQNLFLLLFHPGFETQEFELLKEYISSLLDR